ncbi:MAG: DNA mismatch repair endonuclease MutL [Desulfuromonadaceae bacterium]
MNPEVAILPEKLCNQIAAGEVVERPASVVKELVENSIDAGSTRIVVEVVNGGTRLIKVNDNGRGMNQHDIFLCFERHATSKIRTEEDLFRLGSLGFRGEALPAIAAVSRLKVSSRHRDADVGMRVDLKGGVVIDTGEAGMPGGSVFEVRDLFYNLPARRKFLRKTTTEFGHVAESVMRLSLAHPHIQFQLIHNERVVFNYYRQHRIFDRIGEALGRSVAGALHRIDSQRGEIALEGYVAAPEQNRSSTQAMYTYINGRFIRDPVVKHAVLDAYRQLLMKGRYPICVLFLHMPPDRVDVNVHPTKHEVRFHDQRLVHDFITDAVRQQLREITDNRQACFSAGEGTSDSDRELFNARAPGRTDVTCAPAPMSEEPERQQDRNAYPSSLEMSHNSTVQHTCADVATGTQAAARVAESDSIWDRTRERAADPEIEESAPKPVEETQSPTVSTLNVPAQGGYFSSLRIVGQYARSYLVCEDGDDLILIDQHAAHERIGFERLRAQYACSAVERQELLFPQMLELTQAQDVQMSEHVDYFAQLGFEVDPFGGTTWALKALPVLLEEHDIVTLILDILADLSRWGTPQAGREAVDEVLIKMACHSMVRANETLDMREMHALLVQLDEVDFNRHCPHGRPVSRHMKRREIEKLFART